MPNQLAPSKRRQSLAEHEAVLAALAEIARVEDTSVMALLRDAARDAVRKRASNPEQTARLQRIVGKHAPVMPARFRSLAKLARFKRAQREFDRALLEMNLASPQAVQNRNSITASTGSVELVDFDRAHASATV